ncbi:Flp family type IVb pilin [Roseovarius rhodophyticola]|uniref:Pilus assembly protein n=1 Tax=Roseovarius rhodophyticola TaxID=3080827 RepID=A0ABZ2TC36_9RHOB|nr:hypothetical protein [Roseovarius sp. W115]MDV2930927.1 hypothetical protein [Roseovarius sp. W115]
MKNLIKSFLKRDEGAVTVDWVVLTAAIIGLAVGAIDQVGSATDAVADSIADGLEDIDVGTNNSGSGG